MNQENNLLTQLSAALPDLNKSEAKVANAILEDPEAATRSSIAVLATAAGVSEPSVNRFCKRFGAMGFPDFKLRLARSLVSGVRYISRAVELDDDINTYPRKLFDNTITALILGS
jgi:RpiR family carbohydrate utilization transcriptional regulator